MRLPRTLSTRSYAPLRTGGFRGPSARGAAERKTIDGDNRSANISSTADIHPINLVATGTDYTNRIGRRINCVTVQMRGFFDITGGASTDVDCTRIMIVEDMQSNGTAPIITDILNQSHPCAMMNLNNRERFKVHWDRMFNLGLYETANFYNKQPTVNVYRRVNIPMEFGGTTAAIGSVTSGALFVVVLGSAAAATWRFSYNTRVRFTDV